MNDKMKLAAIEAIYYWERSEAFYHKCFFRLDKVLNDKDAYQFFLTKVFSAFLKEYSVRRNIAQGDINVGLFARGLIDSGFYGHVKEGKTSAVDEYSQTLCEENPDVVNGRQTR